MFPFDMNMKSCIFDHFGVISLIYLFVCMYINYKAHNRFTKETFFTVSNVDVNMFPALRSIPFGTMHINLRSCILNRHKLQVTNCDKSGILAVAFCDFSQFVIKAVTAQTQSNNTENVIWVLGGVPIFTFDMNMKSCIFVNFNVISLVYLFVCMYTSY